MSADATIFNHLITDPVLTGLVQNIFIGRVPNNDTFPILQLQQIGGGAVNTLQAGRNDLRNPNYQIDVYAATRELASQIESAAVDRLANNPPVGLGALSLDEPFTIYEEDANDNRLTSRISVWYTNGG